MCCEPADAVTDAVTITPPASSPPPVVAAPPWHVDRVRPETTETYFADTPLAVMPSPELLAALTNRDRILAVLAVGDIGINMEGHYAAVAE